MRGMLKPGWCALLLLAALGGAGNCAAPLGDDGVAARIAAVLNLRPRERVLIRYDPASSRTLAQSVEVRVRAAKARVGVPCCPRKRYSRRQSCASGRFCSAPAERVRRVG